MIGVFDLGYENLFFYAKLSSDEVQSIFELNFIIFKVKSTRYKYNFHALATIPIHFYFALLINFRLVGLVENHLIVYNIATRPLQSNLSQNFDNKEKNLQFFGKHVLLSFNWVETTSWQNLESRLIKLQKISKLHSRTT